MFALLVLATFSTFLNFSQAEPVDEVCYDSLPTEVPENCCKASIFNKLEHFDNQCGQYKLSEIFGNKELSGEGDMINACYVQCIWNNTEVMESMNVMNATKLTAVFKQLLAEHVADKDVVDILENTLEACAANVYNNIEYGKRLSGLVYESHFSPVEGIKCSKVPFLIMLCSDGVLFRNCPERYWQKEEKNCPALLKFKQCMNDIKMEEYKKLSVDPSGIAVIH